MIKTQVREKTLIGINIVEQQNIVLDNIGNIKDQTNEDVLIIARLFSKRYILYVDLKYTISIIVTRVHVAFDIPAQ